MKNKILFVANIHKHFRAFHLPYIAWLRSQGYEVHVAANDGLTKVPEADKQYVLPITRNPFTLSNISATIKLKKIINQEEYCLIHCHTPMGSATARLAAKSFRKNGLKVLYSVHGFHFYKGSPKKFWMLYYPVEKFLSKYTDGLITTNQEDFELVKNKNFHNKHTFYIPGVGIDTSKFNGINPTDKNTIRAKNGYAPDIFLALYVAEFIPRKNHIFLLQATEEIKKHIKNFKIVLLGRGQDVDKIKKLAKELGVSDSIDFLGFRKDIAAMYTMCDVGLSVSKQEGLPMNIAEQIYAGKPIIASDIRGHRDLIEHQKTGYLFKDFSVNDFAEYFFKLYHDKNIYNDFSKAAKIKSKKFELENSLNAMERIYRKFLD